MKRNDENVDKGVIRFVVVLIIIICIVSLSLALHHHMVNNPRGCGPRGGHYGHKQHGEFAPGHC